MLLVQHVFNFCAVRRVAHSMLTKIPHFGYVLTDCTGLPRYWATAWTLLIGGSLAESTLKKRLSHIEAFYQHLSKPRPPLVIAEQRYGKGLHLSAWNEAH
jgi:hypothetical protein